MNFDLNPDQKMIVESVAGFVKKELPIERMRKMRDNEAGYSRDVWRKMGELGWLGISFPESVGGFGGNFVEASLVLQQFGTTLVSEPYTDAAVVAGHALLESGSSEQHERYLSPMIAGERVVAFAHLERDGRYQATHVTARADKSGDGYRLKGEKRWVMPADADHYVVVARTSGGDAVRDGVSLFVLDASEPGLEKRVVKTMDGRRAAMLHFDCTVGSDRLLGTAGQAAPIIEKVLDLGAAGCCAEGVGLMRAALAMTLEYLKTREQFGLKIGTFQALQHRAVDMFIETQLAQSTAIMAAIKANDPDPLERQRAISAAKVQLAQSGRLVTQQAIQLHGGIGITDEADIGLYFKRMHALATLYGDEEHHVGRYMSLPSFTANVA
ncbi:MAG TPA: acyl-CoA dehydrogenase [Polyangiaceae bacterium]|nr:acyl-CoA dehydrogenase [Polyangiaceae bacterium]